MVDRRMAFYLASSSLDSVYMSKVDSEIWGHPKSHANIDYDLDGNLIECVSTCSASGHYILRFAGKGLRFFRIPALGYTMLSVLRGQLSRALLNIRGMYDIHLPSGFKLEVGEANHLMSNQLRKLGWQTPSGFIKRATFSGPRS